MYFAVARYKFLDNSFEPNSIGHDALNHNCTATVTDEATPTEFSEPIIADLLVDGGKTFAVYADGYADTVAAAPDCPSAPSDCPEILLTGACKYDRSDIPFEFYPRFRDNPKYMKDYERDFAADVAGGSLPNFSYVKFRVYRNEHPGFGKISTGETWVNDVYDKIRLSPIYSNNTLIILTWDEGGGFYDHVAPPSSIETFPVGDAHEGSPVPYGTRVPMLALGHFARRGHVSHVQMEHSSLVKFLEYNFLGPSHVGDLHGRDAMVNNIGDMLDPAVTGIVVP